jgi:hypothetical protein
MIELLPLDVNMKSTPIKPLSPSLFLYALWLPYTVAFYPLPSHTLLIIISAACLRADGVALVRPTLIYLALSCFWLYIDYLRVVNIRPPLLPALTALLSGMHPSA